jgi:hypothetical protein
MSSEAGRRSSSALIAAACAAMVETHADHDRSIAGRAEPLDDRTDERIDEASDPVCVVHPFLDPGVGQDHDRAARSQSVDPRSKLEGGRGRRWRPGFRRR